MDPVKTLHFSFLGPCQASSNGHSLLPIRSSKAQALLIYLGTARALQPGVAPRREMLMELLWPGTPLKSAQLNLRQVLFQLRRLIPEVDSQHGDRIPFVLADRQTIQVHPDARFELDVATFVELLKGEALPGALAAAACLYRGDFLVDFYLPDSNAFESWSAALRATFRRQHLDSLERLTATYLRERQYAEAAATAHRQLEVDDLREHTYRQLMTALARQGRRSDALAHYQSCRQRMNDELGLEPSAETLALVASIRAGELETPTGAARPDLLLPMAAEDVEDEWASTEETGNGATQSVFVGRQSALAQLHEYLSLALAGQGQVVLVTGEAGAGKTTLMQRFARRALEENSELLVVAGHCQAFVGIGDPYLPFRQVIEGLLGNIASGWTGRAGREELRRLQLFLPEVIRALATFAPALASSFVSRPHVLQWAEAERVVKPWFDELAEQVSLEGASVAGRNRGQLFEQYAALMQELAAKQPLLILVDDLQWADTGSIDLLLYLVQRLAGARILLVASYRAEEVAAGASNQRHPLESIVNELKRRFGDIWIDLDDTGQEEGRNFVEALIDSQPNQLGDSFREALFRITNGHALFTAELLQAMRARGDLIQDARGQWAAGPVLDWTSMPTRVEGVIAERISRLDEELQQLLAVASVVGEEFTAQLVGQVLERDERHVLRELSHVLERRHRLVQASGEEAIADSFLSRYRFSHALVKQYCYSQLSIGEKRLLHGRIAAKLERLYEGHDEHIVLSLAHHYAEAGNGRKAIAYLLQAGDRASALYAHDEGIRCYLKALTFLRAEGQLVQVGQTLMKLGLAYHNAFDFARAREAYDEGFELWSLATTTSAERLPALAPQPLRLASPNPTTLDPALLSQVPQHLAVVSLVEQLFSGLVVQRSGRDILPDVAQSWEVLDGGRRYVFHLRDGLRWSDGIALTADDFVYAWKRVLHPATMSPIAHLLFDIKNGRAFHEGQISDGDAVEVRAPDAKTLVVGLEEPAAYFLHLASRWPMYPVPRHVVERHGSSWTQPDKITCNGPFSLVSWQPNSALILRRNPAYHGQFTGNVQEVKVTLLPLHAFASRYKLYESDALDILPLLAGITRAGIALLCSRHAEELVSRPTLTVFLAGFNVRQEPFADWRVRRAFAHGTDYNFIDVSPYAIPATGGLVPPNMPGHSPGIALSFHPEYARQLLAQAGYPGGRGFPRVPLYVTPGAAVVAEHLCKAWHESLRLEVACEIVDILDLDHLRNAAGIFLTSRAADYPDPHCLLKIGSLQYETGWKNEEYERLVAEAGRVTDQAERMKLYARAEQILVNEAVIIPLFYLRRHHLLKPWVKKCVPDTISGQAFWKDVLIEPH